MPWYVPVLLKILIGNGLTPILIKQVAGLSLRTYRFFLQFLFCSVLGFGILYVSSGSFSENFSAAILLVGFFNGLAAYCQWRAIDISLSKNSLFTFWDDAIAMTLSYVVLNEGVFLTRNITVGIILSFAAVILFTLRDYRKKEASERTPLKFYFFVVMYSLIWGITVFLMRYFGTKGIPIQKFIANWYTGTFLAATVILLVWKEKSPLRATTIGIYGSLKIFILSVAIMASLGAAYWSYQLNPQTIVQPIFLIGEMVLPALLGFYFFKEIGSFDGYQKIYFIIGVTGGLIIAFNFR